jgi:hypothetical protein
MQTSMGEKAFADEDDDGFEERRGKGGRLVVEVHVEADLAEVGAGGEDERVGEDSGLKDV